MNRTNTAVSPENPIRHAATNIGPIDVNAMDSNDLFVIQEHPGPSNHPGLDNLQLTQMDSNSIGPNPASPSPPTQLIESSPEREDSPDHRQLQQVLLTNTQRRNEPLGTINSVKSEEDNEKNSRSEKLDKRE